MPQISPKSRVRRLRPPGDSEETRGPIMCALHNTQRAKEQKSHLPCVAQMVKHDKMQKARYYHQLILPPRLVKLSSS